MEPIIPTKISFDDTSIAFSAKSDKQLRKMYYLFKLMNNVTLVDVGKSLLKFAFKLHLPVARIVKKTVFEHFCGGEMIEECNIAIQQLAHFHIGTILDYSVEGEKDEKSFDATKDEIIHTIEKAKQNPAIPFCVFKVTGIASFDLLEKIQSHQALNTEEAQQWQKAKARVNEICKKAYDNQVRILIDGEESWIQDTIDQLAYEMMQQYNKQAPIVYNTYQMYRHDMLGNLKKALHHAVMHEYYLGAKLVRGAYMEKERARANEKGYESPIQPTKEATDVDFNKALQFCIDNLQRIALCAGTHNEYSNSYLLLLMEKYNILPKDTRIYFAQLYGMSDQISYTLAKYGYNVAKYVPYGPVKAVMPYLFRRAEENTSIAGQTSREFLLIKKEIAKRKGLKK